MQRRRFLKLSALTFTSLLGQAGCRDPGGGDGGGSTGGSTGGSGSGTAGTGDTDGREVVDAPELFPQSIASGDPKPGSVILWTRVDDPELPDADHEVEVEIWPLDGGGEGGLDGTGGGGGEPMPTVVMVTAEAAFDHCVKVKVEGLDPGTDYGYRFLYIKDGVAYASRSGQTKTAPSPDADVPVRFGFVSCQDYGEGYYNAYARMVDEPMDFFVHLGDYIYETANNAEFQGSIEGRELVFDDEAGALALESGDGSTYYAARSLDNYRQLYRTYRSDAALQAVHERMAMIAIWDDHEFSNDCWGATGTYTNGRENEHDVERRRTANQVWFEYMPVDYAQDGFVYDAQGAAPPDDIQIYRDFTFGQHLHLVMTDLRSYRPDHLIPENAYPGTIAVDEAGLLSVQPDTSGGVPYVDIDDFSGGMYADLLRTEAEAADYSGALIVGNISAEWINEVITDTGSALPLISPMELDALPRGIAFHQMFKTSLYSFLGTRALVVREPFLIYAQWLHDVSGGDAQRLMGQEQQDWFLSTMQGSDRTWKVWGNEFCLTGLDIDLTSSFLPDAFRQAFTMSTEDWNGFPNHRADLIDALAGVDNVVAITGDIHAFFAGTPFWWSGESDGNRIVEFVTSSISSRTYQSSLVTQVQSNPSLSMVAGIEAFALGISDLLTGGPNPCMAHADTGRHGFAVVHVDGAELLVDFHAHPEDLAQADHYGDASLGNQFTVTHFRVQAGSRDLYRDFDGTWMRWDAPTRSWV